MTKFNLKKQAETKSRKPYEKQLIDENEKFDLEPADSRPYEKQLDSDRNPNKGDKNYEKMLEDARIASPVTITDKQLNADATKRSDDGFALMDMGEVTSKEAEKEFKKAQDKEPKETPFYEKYDNPIPENGNAKTTIVNNVQDSQMVSNYDTREEFNKANPSMKKASNAANVLKDADALLYHLHRKASDQNRSLNEKEQNMIDNINENKVKILSGLIK